MKKAIQNIGIFIVVLLAFIASLPQRYVQGAVNAGLFAPPTVRAQAMTATTVDRETARKEPDIQSFPVYTGTAIQKGTLVMLNASGYLIPGADTASCKFAGIAMESVTAAEVTSSGAKWVKVYRTGRFKLAAQAIAQSNVGDLCYIADNQTIEDAAGSVTNDIICGKIVEYISATSCWVDIGDRVA